MSKASLLVDRSGADIWVGHAGMHNVDFPHSIPMRWVHRIRSIPGVAEAEPMRIGFADMKFAQRTLRVGRGGWGDGKHELGEAIQNCRRSN